MPWQGEMRFSRRRPEVLIQTQAAAGGRRPQLRRCRWTCQGLRTFGLFLHMAVLVRPVRSDWNLFTFGGSGRDEGDLSTVKEKQVTLSLTAETFDGHLKKNPVTAISSLPS